MSFLKKVFVSSMSLCIGSIAFAGPDLDTRVKELERKMGKVYTKTASGAEGAKTAAARPDVEGSGYFVFFDVFYWQGKTNSSPYGLTSSNFDFQPLKIQGQHVRADLDWDWGFKAGLGVNFDHDGWDLLARYTYFSTSSTSRTSVELPSVIFPGVGEGLLKTPTISSVVDYSLNATSDLSIDYDNVDLGIGRNYFVSKLLSFRPSIGLQATWLNTQQKIYYTGGNTFTVPNTPVVMAGPGVNTTHVKERSRYWGMGPRLGLDSKWYLTNGFSIFGNGSTSLLYGLFHNMSKNWSSSDQDSISIKDNFHRLVPNLNISLGLAYDKYVYNDKQHVSVSLGYETQYYWRANQTLGIDDDVDGQYSTISEDVYFRGVTLEVLWNF